MFCSHGQIITRPGANQHLNSYMIKFLNLLINAPRLPDPQKMVPILICLYCLFWNDSFLCSNLLVYFPRHEVRCWEAPPPSDLPLMPTLLSFPLNTITIRSASLGLLNIGGKAVLKLLAAVSAVSCFFPMAPLFVTFF